MKHLLLLVPLFLLACEATDARKQAASDGMAGVDALVSSPEEAVIAEGAKLNIETAVGVKTAELPPPQKTPEQIRAKPQEYLDDAKATSEKFWRASNPWLWAGGGLLALLGILRTFSGAHTPLIGIAQAILENKLDRERRQFAEAMAQAAPVMVRAIDDVADADGGIAALKAVIAKRLPSAAGDAIKGLLHG